MTLPFLFVAAGLAMQIDGLRSLYCVFKLSQRHLESRSANEVFGCGERVSHAIHGLAEIANHSLLIDVQIRDKHAASVA